MYKLFFIQALYRNYKTPIYASSYRHLLRCVNQSAIGSKFHFHREVNENVESKLRKQDELEESFKIIYRAPLKTYIKFTYSTVFGSISTIIPVIGSAMIINGYPYSAGPLTLQGIAIVNNPIELYGLIAALFFISLQVSVVIFSYPLRIYKCPEKNIYTAVFQHFLPWKNQKKKFKQGEVKKNTKGIMPWKDTLYLIKGKKVILIEDAFTRPIDLQEMMILPKTSKN